MRIFKSGVGDVEMMQLAGLPTRGPHSEVQRSHTRAPDGARRLDLRDEVLDAERGADGVREAGQPQLVALAEGEAALLGGEQLVRWLRRDKGKQRGRRHTHSGSARLPLR